jgi:mRNA-degrading endonuclease toxin of MazEF toxin-antitoxin module
MMVEIVPPEGGLWKKSYSMAFQVRTVSHSRFVNKLGMLGQVNLLRVVRTVQEIINF